MGGDNNLAPGQKHENTPDQGSHLHNTHQTAEPAEQRLRNNDLELLETITKMCALGTLDATLT